MEADNRIDTTGVIHLALIAFLIPLPFGRREPAQDRAGWSELVSAFQSRGVAVLNSHPRCREADLDGLYVRGHRELVVCERGDRSLTLRHEGWHLVQSLCLSGRPWLQPDQMEARLTTQNRHELAVLVTPERRWREAEARAMANLDVKTYLQELDRACPAVTPADAPMDPSTDTDQDRRYCGDCRGKFQTAGWQTVGQLL